MEQSYNGGNLYESAADYAIEKLQELVGEEVYLSEIVEHMMYSDNLDGGIYLYTADNIKFIANNFMEIGEIYEDLRKQGMIDEFFNPFANPASLVFLAMESAINDLLGNYEKILRQLGLLDDWNEQVKINQMMVDALVQIIESNFQEFTN